MNEENWLNTENEINRGISTWRKPVAVQCAG